MATSGKNSNYKAPPALRDDLGYEDWKKELKIWQAFTDLEKKRQGGALFLTLTGKSREAVLSEIDVDKLNTDSGIDCIIASLDNLFLKDKAESGFEAFDQFIKFRRPQSMSIKDYILEFNLKYNKIKCQNMKLPEGVLAYALLTCANLPSDQEQLCRATCSELTYQDMKRQIDRISLSNANSHLSSETSDFAPVQYMTHHEEYCDNQEFKDEYGEESENYYTDAEYAYYAHPSYRPTRQYQPNQYRPYSDVNRTQASLPQSKAKLNPPDEFGNPTPCRFCKSIYHWIYDCPVAPDTARFAARGRGRSRGYSGRGGPPRGAASRQF